jgi:hypothetical protein
MGPTIGTVSPLLEREEVIPARKTKECDATEIDPRYVPVVEVFAELRDVSQENREGFGCGALKVKGKILAVMSSKRQFVVKLPK